MAEKLKVKISVKEDDVLDFIAGFLHEHPDTIGADDEEKVTNVLIRYMFGEANRGMKAIGAESISLPEDAIEVDDE